MNFDWVPWYILYSRNILNESFNFIKLVLIKIQTSMSAFSLISPLYLYFLFFFTQMIEGAAGVSLGAFMTNMEQFAGQKTVIIACGANISMEKLKKIIQMEEEKII